MRWLGCAVLTAALLGAACASSREAADSPLEYSENAKRAYEHALLPYFDHDWEEASLRMAEVKRKYGYSRYARLAELRLADIAYHQENYAEAEAAYKSFIHDYPNHPDLPYAQYRIAKTQFEQTSISLLLPPLEERDLANVRDAHETIQEFLAEYGPRRSAPSLRDKVRELEYLGQVVRGLLIRHELYVARFYLKQDRFKAAAARAEYALTHFREETETGKLGSAARALQESPDSRLEPEAMVLLGEIRLKMKQRRAAESLFRKVLAQYPSSPFIIPARQFLIRLGARGGADGVEATAQ